MADKVEWLNKLGHVVQPTKGGQVKGESGLPIRQSFSDGSLVSNYFMLVSYFCFHAPLYSLFPRLALKFFTIILLMNYCGFSRLISLFSLQAKIIRYVRCSRE